MGDGGAQAVATRRDQAPMFAGVEYSMGRLCICGAHAHFKPHDPGGIVRSVCSLVLLAHCLYVAGSLTLYSRAHAVLLSRSLCLTGSLSLPHSLTLCCCLTHAMLLAHSLSLAFADSLAHSRWYICYRQHAALGGIVIH